MKKIIALLLSVLMLLSMAAFAEEAQDTALVCFLHNIVLETGSEGETSQIVLDGLELYASIDTSDGLALVLQAFNGDDSLMLAVIKLVGTQLRISVDGVNKTFVQDIPALAGQDTDGLGETLRPMLPALMNLQLPPISVGSLPKLDLLPLAGMFGAVAEDGSASFSIPHERIDSLLDQVLETGKSMGGSIPGASDLLDLLQQLRDAGASIALEGSIIDSDDRQTISVGILPVSGDQVAESAAAMLNLTSMQDAISLTLDIPVEEAFQTDASLDIQTDVEEAFQTVASLDIQTDAEENACAATLDIAGEMQFNLGVFQEDGLQKVALTMDSSYDASFALDLAYGKSGDTDVTDFSFGIAEEGTFEFVSTSTADEDGTIGSIEIAVVSRDDQFHLMADVEQFISDLDLGGYVQPVVTEGIDNISDEENGAAMQEALKPLIEYFGKIFAGAAA